MNSTTYTEKKSQLETYFDRTAADAWAKLTSDAPVSGVRATVRAGRDAMRANLLNALPSDLTGHRILDAGCGAGQFSFEAAQRGADVVGVDLSKTLLDLARERYGAAPTKGAIEFVTGDMFDPALGSFDHVVAMDSLIHYAAPDIVRVLEGFAARTSSSILFTFAPKTPLLATMHAVGQFFPRADRSPAIQPVAEKKLQTLISESADLNGWTQMKSHRVQSGFYISNAMELNAR
ncbi:MAG: magnesium protoporphyrin IX methyltransferase [Pseudomonadota bacterium]